MTRVRRPDGPRRGQLVHVDADGPFDAVAIEPGVSDVLVIVHHNGAVVGQTWLAGHRPEVPASELEAAVGPHAKALRTRRIRAAVERATGRPAPNSPTRTVSVVVCTRDRADQLRQCLESLLRLRRPDVELLVVDNGSTDDGTRRVCEELGVRMVVEPRPGQTSARNCGVAATAGELVAFTDDDVIVDPGWLDNIDAEFDDPMTMIATGYIGPGVLDHESQVFFEAHGGFERHPDRKLIDPSDYSLVSGACAAGAGANMVIRRQLFEEIGGFDESFGAGTPTRTSDDKLFYYRALEAGFRIRYDPARKVWHQHRSSPDALKRIYRDYGTGEFTWTTHVLKTARDRHALTIHRWWLAHFVQDIARWRGRQIEGIPPRYTVAEVRGALASRRALHTVKGARPAGGPGPHTGWSGLRTADASDPASAAAPRVTVVSELPTTTVAIGSYNRRDSLERVLRQLDAQTMPRERFDVVLVLDGCTDGSAEMARSIEVGYDLRVIEQPANRGLAVGRNVGAATATGDVVVFLDDDIEPRPTWLAAHAAAHANRAVDTWVMGYFPPVPSTNLEQQAARVWWEDHFRRKAMPGHRWTMVDMVDGNSSVPTRLFQRLGGFDEDFSGGRRQDYEMGLRLLAAGVPMAYAADAAADHRTVTSLAGDLRTAYAEGWFDALIARKYPAAWNQLLIAAVPKGPKSHLGRAVATRLGPERGVVISERLAAAGLRGAWKFAAGHCWWSQYCAGFADGAGGDRLGPPRELVRERVVLDLDAPDPSVVPEQVANLEFAIRMQGRIVAVVPALRPGGHQWDWEDLIDRATRAVLKRAPAAQPEARLLEPA